MVKIKHNSDLKVQPALIANDNYEVVKVSQQKMQGWVFVLLDGEQVVRVACPGCGETGLLTDHRIHEKTGEVWPSLVCPNNCGFHDIGTLDSYEKHRRWHKACEVRASLLMLLLC